MDNQIEGGSGKAQNVNGTKDDQAPITAHNFGIGVNTEVAMQRLEGNRAVYNHDQGMEEAYGQMKEPDQYAEKITKPGFV